MRIAVISCWKYRDAWKPFRDLLNIFWPGTDGYEVIVISDTPANPRPWCQTLLTYVMAFPSEPLLLMQEDFWLTARVDGGLVRRALWDYEAHDAGCVRLYPCPGGIEDYGDNYFAIVPKGTPYRISCQAAIWRPTYLMQILNVCGETAADFELMGTPLSDLLDDKVLAFKRDVKPWPMEYLCTAILRGKWNPDAKKLAEAHGIEVDWSLRGFVTA